MNIYEFANEVAAMATGYTAEVHDVVKNNDTILTGISFRKDESDIAPTVYINKYFQMYSAGELSMEDAVASIEKAVEDAYRNAPIPMTADSIAELVTNYDNAKGKIRSRLLNTGRNKKLLEDLPHINLADLSVIFYLELSEDDGGVSSIKVTNSIFNKWGVTMEELLKVANAQTIWQVKSMAEVLREMMRAHGDSDDMLSLLDTPEDAVPMFVASNITKLNGAAILANTKELERFSKAHGEESFYILPSSVHECLFLPVDKGETPDVTQLEEMVRSVNKSQVAPEDFLSDNVYFYDAKKKKVFLTFGNREEAVI